MIIPAFMFGICVTHGLHQEPALLMLVLDFLRIFYFVFMFNRFSHCRCCFEEKSIRAVLRQALQGRLRDRDGWLFGLGEMIRVTRPSANTCLGCFLSWFRSHSFDTISISLVILAIDNWWNLWRNCGLFQRASLLCSKRRLLWLVDRHVLIILSILVEVQLVQLGFLHCNNLRLTVCDLVQEAP